MLLPDLWICHFANLLVRHRVNNIGTTSRPKVPVGDGDGDGDFMMHYKQIRCIWILS